MLCITHACHFWQGIYYFYVSRYIVSVLVLPPSQALMCVSFHLLKKKKYILSDSFPYHINSTWYPIKCSQGMFHCWIAQINRCLVSVPQVRNPRQTLSLLLFLSVSFLRSTWVEFLLGRIETIGQTGAISDGCGCATQEVYLDLRMGSPDIHNFFFPFESISGPVSCPVFICCWKTFGRSYWKPPSTFVIHPHPVSFLRHVLILPVNRKSPLIRIKQ